jgi:salicylate hydroxylase
LHTILLNAAKPYMHLRLSSRVVAVDPESMTLTLANGETVHADIVIGADGIHSMLREIVVGHPCPATPTGDAAYRAIIPTDVMLQDPDLRPLVENPEMTGWMGPGKHIMAYCIVGVAFFFIPIRHLITTTFQRSQKEYNMVMIHPDTSGGSEESWTAEVSAEEMRNDFAGWEPRYDPCYLHIL